MTITRFKSRVTGPTCRLHFIGWVGSRRLIILRCTLGDTGQCADHTWRTPVPSQGAGQPLLQMDPLFSVEKIDPEGVSTEMGGCGP